MSANASAGRIETRGVDEVNHFVAPWDVRLRQMAKGEIRGRTDYLQVNGILVYREHFTHRLMVSGATPAGFFTIGGPASPTTLVNWCGSELGARCLAYGLSSTEVDFVLPDNSRHVVLLVPDDLLRRYLGEESAAALLRDGHVLGCDAMLNTQFVNMIDRLVSKYQAGSELLSDNRICRAIESQLLGSMAEILFAGKPNSACASPRKRYLAFRRAIRYADDRRQPTAVPELAAAAGVSQRTLELAFQETIGVSPRKYLRWIRLNRVQQALRSARPGRASVTEIAAHWGFSELGRFAVEYRNLIGETPSSTLAIDIGPLPRRLADTFRDQW